MSNLNASCGGPGRRHPAIVYDYTEGQCPACKALDEVQQLKEENLKLYRKAFPLT